MIPSLHVWNRHKPQKLVLFEVKAPIKGLKGALGYRRNKKAHPHCHVLMSCTPIYYDVHKCTNKATLLGCYSKSYTDLLYNIRTVSHSICGKRRKKCNTALCKLGWPSFDLPIKVCHSIKIIVLQIMAKQLLGTLFTTLYKR